MVLGIYITAEDCVTFTRIWSILGWASHELKYIGGDRLIRVD